jgi:hypothetical protein
MKELVAAFQFEVRYNYILNFSQIYRKLVTPYVKLASRMNIQNQSTVEERMILNFDDEDYYIIINWQSIFIRGQGNLENFTSKNSPMVMPFFDILEKIQNLEEFAGIANILFMVNYIKEIDIQKDKLFDYFASKSLSNTSCDLLDDVNDSAVILVNKNPEGEVYLNYGPYFGGNEELEKRAIAPVNKAKLGEIDFMGLLVEYKHVKIVNEISFQDFVAEVKNANKTFKKVWKSI